MPKMKPIYTNLADSKQPTMIDLNWIITIAMKLPCN